MHHFGSSRFHSSIIVPRILSPFMRRNVHVNGAHKCVNQLTATNQTINQLNGGDLYRCVLSRPLAAPAGLKCASKSMPAWHRCAIQHSAGIVCECGDAVKIIIMNRHTHAQRCIGRSGPSDRSTGSTSERAPYIFSTNLSEILGKLNFNKRHKRWLPALAGTPQIVSRRTHGSRERSRGRERAREGGGKLGKQWIW